MAQEWNIKSRSAVCKGCQTAFSDRQEFYTALNDCGDGYERIDYCRECWRKNQDSHNPHSMWRSTFIIPPPPAPEPLKKETAEGLLRKMIEDDEARADVIYILAVMLERKKVLIEREVQTADDGSIVRIYEHRATQDSFIIRDPGLKLHELDDVQQAVVDMLGGGKAAAPAACEERRD